MMKLPPHKLSIPIGITTFQIGVKIVVLVGFMLVAMVAFYILTVPSQSVSSIRYAGPGSIGGAAHVSGSGAVSKLKRFSELGGLKDEDSPQDTTEKDGSSNDRSVREANTSDDAISPKDASPTEVPENTDVPPETPATDAPQQDLLGPLRSQIRAVHAVRFAVFISSILICMVSVVALLKVNRLSHGKYAGRLWWIGLLVIPGWLLAGVMVAWNNGLWDSMFDANGLVSFW